MNNPRKIAVEMMKKNLSHDQWNEKLELVKNIKDAIQLHSIKNHPIISSLNDGKHTLSQMQNIHLEYRHAIVQIFTDALLMTQYQSKQLESRYPPGVKMIPRFLITLNILDEFGFSPGVSDNQYYKGNPTYAHYPLFEALLKDYQLTKNDIENFIPSAISNHLRNFLKDAYNNFSLLLALLATAEIEVMLFSPPLMKNTKKLGIGTDNGYYYVHGSSSDANTNAYDDDHENDLWNILLLSIKEEEVEYIKLQCIKYCDLWHEFWDYQLKIDL